MALKVLTKTSIHLLRAYIGVEGARREHTEQGREDHFREENKNHLILYFYLGFSFYLKSDRDSDSHYSSLFTTSSISQLYRNIHHQLNSSYLPLLQLFTIAKPMVSCQCQAHQSPQFPLMETQNSILRTIDKSSQY